jgi:hypothetical protein
MSRGAKCISLNQKFHEIKIDSFLDIRIDGWIYLSIEISFARSPKSLIWPGNKAQLWAQEVKGMNSVASPPHFFIFLCPFGMRLTRHWHFALLLFLHWRVRMDFVVLSQRKWKGLCHIEMSIHFPPQMRWGISHLCPFIFMKGIEARPSSRRSNNQEHLSIQLRTVTGSPITRKANFHSPNPGSSCVVIVDSYKDMESTVDVSDSTLSFVACIPIYVATDSVSYMSSARKTAFGLPTLLMATFQPPNDL